MICSEGLGLGHAADIARGKSQTLEHGQLLGGQFEEELFAFIRSGGVFFHCFQEFVGHHAAGQLAAVEHFRHPSGKQIHVADHRYVDAADIEEEFHFVELPHVVTELGNHPLRTAGDLADELEILRQQFALVAFERRDRAADKKIGFRQGFNFARAPWNLKTFVHRPQHGNQCDRVEVEHRLGKSAESGSGIIAGNGKDVAKTFGRVAPGGGFQSVAVEILAGHVQNNPITTIRNHAAKPVGREHRPAAGIIGDRDPAHARIAKQIAGERGKIIRRIWKLEAPGSDHFHAVIESLA